MKAGFVIGSLSRSGGGLFDAARHLGGAMHAPPALEVEVIGLTDEHWPADMPHWGPLKVTALTPVALSGNWGWAPGLRSAIDKATLDVLHVHGLWMYQSLASLGWARRGGRVMISPHGMLDPWALKPASLAKGAAALFYEGAHLRRAACLHALCDAELKALRAYGISGPVCIVPNAVHLPDEAPVAPARRGDGEDVLLFLGRLHPKKGLAPLLQAWAQVAPLSVAHNWRLAIAGWDEGGYAQQLSQMRDSLALKRVDFIGPQFGAAKSAAFRGASAFILPSFSEGLPMAVLEAWSYGLPVIMSPACNLPQGFAAQAALEASPHPDSIARALRALMSLSTKEREEMGARGRQLVARSFSWGAAAAQMRSVYTWILGGGAPPDCVHLS